MKKSKLIRITVGIVLFLLICTVLSRTISEALMPQVIVGQAQRATIQDSKRVTGTLFLGKEKSVYAPCDMTIEAVHIERFDFVDSDAQIFEVNQSQLEIEKSELEIAIMQLEIEGDNWMTANQKLEWNKRMDSAQKCLNSFMECIPQNGIITAAEEGQIVSVYAHPGETVAKGQLLYTYYTNKNVTPYILFYTDDDEMELDIGDSVEIEYEETSWIFGEKVVSVKSLVSTVSGKLPDDLNGWAYKIEIDGLKGCSDRQEVTLRITKTAKVYDQVLPLTAITSVPDDIVLYVIRTKQGVFGEEFYVRQIYADEIRRNEQYIAVMSEDLVGVDVVISTNRGLADGMQVRVIG